MFIEKRIFHSKLELGVIGDLGVVFFLKCGLELGNSSFDPSFGERNVKFQKFVLGF